MSLSTPTDLHDDISIFEQSSPESLRARALSPHLHDHRLSTSDEQTLNTDNGYISSTSIKTYSNRSSISSFPGSVIHTFPFTDTEDGRSPSRSQAFQPSKSCVPNYLSAFRNPSSVRALQLESDWADSDASSRRSHSRSRRSSRLQGGSRSPGSVQSTSVKRSSRPATPRLQSNSKLKKEFPLVLLHCSLLPPDVATRGPSISDEILEAVLPEQYRKNWKVLQDKVVKNNEVKQRGVLIPHPREDYDLLEESLLESLELERPRIRKDHFLGPKRTGSDSGFESSSQNGTDEASDTEQSDKKSKERCLDCGKGVSCDVEQERRWEVKVFAANGLMKSGAWAAAWEEMEKVDVQVGVWMPHDVRTEVEERLKALQAMEEAERPVDEHLERKTRTKRTRSNTAKLRHDERMREIYGEANELNSDKLDAHTKPEESPVKCEAESQTSQNLSTAKDYTTEQKSFVDLSHEDFPSFMRRHAKIIWHDQRNLAIVLLSIMVLIFSFQSLNSTAHPTLKGNGLTTVVTDTGVEPRVIGEPSLIAQALTLSTTTGKQAATRIDELEVETPPVRLSDVFEKVEPFLPAYGEPATTRRRPLATESANLDPNSSTPLADASMMDTVVDAIDSSNVFIRSALSSVRDDEQMLENKHVDESCSNPSTDVLLELSRRYSGIK